jgi:alanine racemase
VTIHDELRVAGLPALTRDAWVEVDLDALRWNMELLRRRLDAGPEGGRPTQGAAERPRPLLGVVVKADAYGHGIERCAVEFADAGADLLAVATLDEALRLRGVGITAPVLILTQVPGHGLADAAGAECAVTVGDLDGVRGAIDAWRMARVTHPELTLGVQLEVDSGMTRGGVAPERAAEALRLLASTPGLEVRGVWSHLASPERDEETTGQLTRFDEVLARLGVGAMTGVVTHVATSDPLLLGRAGGYDQVRIGIAAYGIVDGDGALAAADPGLRPALSLHGLVLRVARVPAGTRVGYGGEWTASRPSVIATVPVGYGDGYARSSWPGAQVLVGGRRCPVVGRVSMDAVTVDVTDVPGVGVGDPCTFIGEQGAQRIGAGELAGVRRTIAREVVTTLGMRLARVYRRRGAVVAVRLPSGTIAVTDAMRPGTG